jgi:hypothetical protein
MGGENIVSGKKDDLKTAYRGAWSLFIAIERGDNDTIEAIWQEFDEETLLRGWHVVAARLLKSLREHGEAAGCGCGSDEWLNQERFRIAEDS